MYLMKVDPASPSGLSDSSPSESDDAASASPRSSQCTESSPGESGLELYPQERSSTPGARPPAPHSSTEQIRSCHAFSSGTGEQVEVKLNHLLTWYGGRGIDKFHNPKGVLPAGDALAQAQIKKVMLLTGFSVDTHQPDGALEPLPLSETDGPPGTAALAHALMVVGKIVVIVTDKANEGPTRAALRELSPEAEQYAQFVIFDHKQGPAAEAHANQLIDHHRPDAVVAVELPGRNVDGNRLNMRGIKINDCNGAVDELLIQANKRGDQIVTIGVGDGGNEAGMGGLEGIPLALNGEAMASDVPARHQVTAWNSNLGAEAIAAVVLQRHGKLHMLHSPAQQTAMIEASMRAGAVDGVTRGGETNVEAANGTAGVDGHAPFDHRAVLRALKTAMADLPPNGIAQKREQHDAPFLIAVFDSSNGGIIAAKNLMGYLKYRTLEKARIVIVVDHGNAPYGPKDPSDLLRFVRNGLKISEQAGVDAIAMACNTACIAFPDALDRLPKNLPILDLIDVTADAIKEHGGAHPFALTTQGTFDSNAYQKAGIDRGQTINVIPMPNWVTQINDLQHLDETTLPAILTDIHQVVDSIPPIATSVWLCCTHYPAYKPFIEKRLKGTNRNLRVVDPMSFQADKIIEMMDKQKNVVDHPRLHRCADLSPYIITSGSTADKVEESAKKLLGGGVPFDIEHVDFGKPFNPMMLRKVVEQQLSDTSLEMTRNSNTERQHLSCPLSLEMTRQLTGASALDSIQSD